MEKKVKIILLVLILGLSLTACKDRGLEELNISTASTSGALYPLGSSLASLWNEKIPGLDANAQASNGGLDNLNLLAQKESHVSMAVTSIAYDSYHGEGLFEGRPNKDLRVIAGLYYNPNQVVVRSDSGIESLVDLKGKKFASGAPGSTTEVESEIHLSGSGLNYPDDILVQHIGFSESVDLMRNRQIDGAWIMAGTPTAAVTEMISTAKGKLISLDRELIDKLIAQYPWYSPYTIKANTYPNQDEDIETTAVKLVLLTRADLDDDLVYQLTKSFWENLDRLKEANQALKDLDIEAGQKDLAGLLLHPGAERYYNEINK